MGTEYRKGQASGDPNESQLAQGDATALNEAVSATTPDGNASNPNEVSVEPVSESANEEAEPTFDDSIPALRDKPDDDLKFLLGPSERPGENALRGVHLASGNLVPPENLLPWLRIMSRVANRPDAPKQVKAMYALAVHRYNEVFR